MYTSFLNTALRGGAVAQDEYAVGMAEGEFLSASLQDSQDFAEEFQISLTTLGNIDLRLDSDKSEGASNMALAVLDSFSGGAASESLGFSMESLSGNQFQEVTLAGVKDMLVSAWEKLVEFLKKLMRKAKAFAQSFFDKMPKLKKAAEKLKEKASDTDGSPKDSKIKIGSAYSKLATGEKKVENLAGHFKTIKALPETLNLDALVTVSKELGNALDKIDGLIDDDGVEQNNFYSTVIKNGPFSTNDVALGADDGKQFGNVTHTLSNATLVKGLPGNTMFGTVFKPAGSSAGNKEKFDRAASLSVKQVTEVPKVKMDNDTEVAALSTSDVENLCDAIIDVADKFEKSGRKEIEDGLKEQDKLIKQAGKVKDKVGKSEFKNVKSTLTSISKAINQGATNLTQPMSMISVYAYQTGMAALSYGNSSLANHES